MILFRAGAMCGHMSRLFRIAAAVAANIQAGMIPTA